MPGYGLADFLHGYIYARFVYQYIGLGKGDLPLARVLSPLTRLWRALRPRPATPPTTGTDLPSHTLADGYHGKVLTSPQARRLVRLDRSVHLPDLEQVIPYVRARALILAHPDHLAVLDCPCRAAQATYCEPLAVCLIVGEPFVAMVLAYHADKARRIGPQEAEEILAAEARRSHVHHAFFKDAMLGRFYAICNCCACCCGAIKLHKNGIPMLAHSGYSPRFEPERCNGCGLCVQSCQFDALSIRAGRAEVNPRLCMGCGVCAGRCARKAVRMEPDPGRGVPLEPERPGSA